MNAAEEIQAFLESGEQGIRSQFTGGTVRRVAEQMFTAKGKPCPVRILNKAGSTYIIRRDAISPK